MSESLDRNKTPLTHVATATAAAWLSGIGCKPVETEVGLGHGWIADLAGFWSPTMTEASRHKLLKALVPEEVSGNTHDKFVWCSRRCGGRLTVVVEVKTSRGDYLADVGRKIGTTTKRPSLDPPAHLCVLACPPGVVTDQEHLAWGWATLKLSADCSRVVKFDGGWNYNPQSPGQIEDLIAGVAERRHNVTQYAALRRWAKAYRAARAVQG